MMYTEDWTGNGSGVLKKVPLLLRACEAGAFGVREVYDSGCVCQAAFTFLCGRPDRAFFEEHPDSFRGRWLVCMTPEWEAFIREQTPENVFRRTQMVPRRGRSAKEPAPLPDGYVLTRFTREVFEAHPFDHGRNYRDWEAFESTGSGAAVLCGDRVVSSASSFISFGDDVELDVFTDPEHRGKGLADHCVKAMLDDCAARGITVHWDAQNVPSAGMAMGHGFAVDQDYAAYILKQA